MLESNSDQSQGVARYHFEAGDQEIPLFAGKSPALAKLVKQARIIAKTNSSIMITGESGTGKDVLARSIHLMSDRAQAPFVAINCSAIPEELLESELFGYTKGSFTGAVSSKVGLFEESSGGTLFLDEIGDMNYKLQSKLLRVVQERKIRRVGDTQEKEIDVRIICATHKDLISLIKENQFREDLYYRLNVIPIHIPPLRERKEDIILLSNLFIRKYAARDSKNIEKLSPCAIQFLLNHDWPGNVRELENTIERAIILSQGNEIYATDLMRQSDLALRNETQQHRAVSLGISGPALSSEVNSMEKKHFFSIDRPMTLEEITNEYIMFVYKHNNLSKEKTYRDLNINRKTLYRKLLLIGRGTSV